MTLLEEITTQTGLTERFQAFTEKVSEVKDGDNVDRLRLELNALDEVLEKIQQKG